MKITTLTYSYLGNLGDYQNERVEATVEVPENATPESVLQELKEWVHSQTHSQKKYFEALDKYLQQKDQLKRIESRLNKAKEKWNQTAEFLRAQGIKPDAPDFPIPMLPALPQAQQVEEVEADLDKLSCF